MSVILNGAGKIIVIRELFFQRLGGSILFWIHIKNTFHIVYHQFKTVRKQENMLVDQYDQRITFYKRPPIGLNPSIKSDNI